MILITNMTRDPRDAHSFCWFCHKAAYILQSLYNTTHYNTVLVITQPGLGSQMVIFLQFLYKIIPLKRYFYNMVQFFGSQT